LLFSQVPHLRKRSHGKSVTHVYVPLIRFSLFSLSLRSFSRHGLLLMMANMFADEMGCQMQGMRCES
jgi:hypothetical protein